MEYKYKTSGTCARSITFSLDEGDRLTGVSFESGCDGNHKGIAALCLGMKAEDVISKLEGIPCGYRNTSCPDQLAQAIKEYIARKGE